MSNERTTYEVEMTELERRLISAALYFLSCNLDAEDLATFEMHLHDGIDDKELTPAELAKVEEQRLATLEGLARHLGDAFHEIKHPVRRSL